MESGMDLANCKACPKFLTNMKSDQERHAETKFTMQTKKVKIKKVIRKKLKACSSDTTVVKLQPGAIFIAENNLALCPAGQLIPW